MTNNAPQTRQLTIADAVRKMEPEFKLALPQHIPSEKFTRIAITALNGNPDLMKDTVDRRSVLKAITLAAQDGLVIDNREAALVLFGNVATYMPMVAGIIKKMRNTGEVANISTGIVYHEEWKQGKFEYIKGDTESLRHEPILFEEKGEMIGAYAVVTLTDGSKVRAFMDKPQIEKVRMVSKSGNKEGKPIGIWAKWYEEMATKTVLRKVAKLCPQSTDLDRAFQDLDDRDEPAHDPQTGEIKPVVTRTGSRAANAVKDAAQNETLIPDAEIIEEGMATDVTNDLSNEEIQV